MKQKKVDIKGILKLEKRKYGDLNDMANDIMNQDIETLLIKHSQGTKTEQLTSFSALVKKFPEYKIFCYPETFLRDNELLICKENCDFVRRSAFYDMVNNYDEVREFVCVDAEEIDTALPFYDWEDEKMRQPSKDEIELIREQYASFIDYKNRLLVEIDANSENNAIPSDFYYDFD